MQLLYLVIIISEYTKVGYGNISVVLKIPSHEVTCINHDYSLNDIVFD